MEMRVKNGRSPIDPQYLVYDPHAVIVNLYDRLEDIRSDIESLHGGHYKIEDFAEELNAIHALCQTGLTDQHVVEYRALIAEPLPEDRIPHPGA